MLAIRRGETEISRSANLLLDFKVCPYIWESSTGRQILIDWEDNSAEPAIWNQESKIIFDEVRKLMIGWVAYEKILSLFYLMRCS